MDILEFIKIDKESRQPKYQQIVNSIIYNISEGHFAMDQKIPSINNLSEEFNISRDTVEKAYNILKERNIISSIIGKGYYITRTKLISKVNVLFLINKLSSYKLITYDSFLNNIGPNSHSDLHSYHCDESLFINLINKHKATYDYYVIMPHFKTEKGKYISSTNAVSNALGKIPKEKLILLDAIKNPTEEVAINIYQDFENDVYYALTEGLEKIKRYKKIILVYPEKGLYPYPEKILFGIRKFCIQHNFEFEVLEEVYDDMLLIKEELIITIEESDLVTLIKLIRDNNYTLGKDIGVLSYNDTPLKELLGISVISTDFKIMGERTAKMILNKEKGSFKVPFNLIDRNSI